VRGLGLPKSVIRKIYSTNAERWFGNPWSESASRVRGDEMKESK
jgi:hypothetical protein